MSYNVFQFKTNEHSLWRLNLKVKLLALGMKYSGHYKLWILIAPSLKILRITKILSLVSSFIFRPYNLNIYKCLNIQLFTQYSIIFNYFILISKIPIKIKAVCIFLHFRNQFSYLDTPQPNYSLETWLTIHKKMLKLLDKLIVYNLIVTNQITTHYFLSKTHSVI